MFQTLPGGVSCFRGQNPFCSLPACATVQSVLSVGPSGASDWVGFSGSWRHCRRDHRPLQRPWPRGGRGITVWTAESSVQMLGVRRSAVFRWKPGIRIAATSYSAPRQRRMSGVVPSPVSACHSCLDWITVPYILLLILCDSDSSSP